MIDQSHNIEPKLEAVIQSVINCQVAYAKTLIIDYPTLDTAQGVGEMLAGHRLVVEAFKTDVLPLLAIVRQEMDRPADPIAACLTDDYARWVAEERDTADAGGGYPPDK